MKPASLIVCLAMIGSFGCTEEGRNKISRTVGNIKGLDLTVSYVDEGKIVKAWEVEGGKLTSADKGYYYFWDKNNKYIQLPIERTIVEQR